MPAIRRLAAQTFTRPIRPNWLHQLAVIGADRLVWRAIIHTSYNEGGLAVTAGALSSIYEDTPRRKRAAAKQTLQAIWPVAATIAIGTPPITFAPQPWATVAGLVVGASIGWVVLSLALSVGSESTAELIRMRRSSHLRRQGFQTWTADALAGKGGLALIHELLPHLPADAAFTVTARDRKTSIVYQRWLTPIPYPRWLPQPDPALALERIPDQT